MSEAEIEKVKKPENFIVVTYKGRDDEKPKEHEIMMSIGLRQRVVAIAASINDITAIYSNVHIQTVLLLEILVPRDKKGKAESGYTLEDFEMTPEEADKLIKWVGDHTLSFFSNAVDNLSSAVGSTGGLTTLMASLSGLVSSQETKPSAGATDVVSPK